MKVAIMITERLCRHTKGSQTDMYSTLFGVTFARVVTSSVGSPYAATAHPVGTTHTGCDLQSVTSSSALQAFKSFLLCTISC